MQRRVMGIKMFARSIASDDGTVAYHECRHSNELRENQISVAHGATDRNPVDSQNQSPLKHNKAGFYEKGDYNQ